MQHMVSFMSVIDVEIIVAKYEIRKKVDFVSLFL